MAVNIRRGGYVAVTKPLLDQFHLHALCDKERCAGVAQVVKTNVLHAVLLQDRGKAIAHVIGRKQLAQRIQTQVVRILAAVRVTKHLGAISSLFRQAIFKIPKRIETCCKQ